MHRLSAPDRSGHPLSQRQHVSRRNSGVRGARQRPGAPLLERDTDRRSFQALSPSLDRADPDRSLCPGTNRPSLLRRQVLFPGACLPACRSPPADVLLAEPPGLFPPLAALPGRQRTIGPSRHLPCSERIRPLGPAPRPPSWRFEPRWPRSLLLRSRFRSCRPPLYPRGGRAQGSRPSGRAVRGLDAPASFPLGSWRRVRSSTETRKESHR